VITGKPDMEALAHALAHCMLAFHAVLSFPKNNVPGRRLWQDCFGIHALP
jgi:hypothetical protein